MNNIKGLDQTSSFSEKVMVGLRIAIRKMVEEAALHDESLVIGDRNGKAKWVPAKELLKALPEE